MIEYEMKFKADHKTIIHKLEALGAKPIKSDYNNDTYYNHPCKDYSSTDEALRIRESGEGTKITYKGPKLDKKSKTREEIEIKIKTDKIPILFKKLGFKPAGMVKKKRKSWKLNGYTIVLDKVNDLGEYVEIEVVREDNSDHENTLNEIYQFVSKLGLNPENQILESYLELIQQSD